MEAAALECLLTLGSNLFQALNRYCQLICRITHTHTHTHTHPPHVELRILVMLVPEPSLHTETLQHGKVQALMQPDGSPVTLKVEPGS